MNPATSRPSHTVQPVRTDFRKQHECRSFCLFDRHELPQNDGALYTDYNWYTKRGVRNPVAFKVVMFELLAGRDIILYVTGLTPALTEFIAEAIQLRLSWAASNTPTGGIRVRHYDRSISDYFEQRMFSTTNEDIF